MCFCFSFIACNYYNAVFLILSLFFLSSHSTSPDTSPYSSPGRPDPTPFRPSIVVVIGVLTTMFSITFLMLLYAKHCKRGSSNGGDNNGGGYYSNYAINEGRKNSGINRGVIETLPIFRFGSLYGQKEGLECAVCLCRFEASEVLRLLPKCKHAFHVECVDTWLDAHSTCPLCRYRVDPEDILLVHDNFRGDVEDLESGVEEVNVSIRRVSGRHSSAGEKGSDVGNHTTSFCRRSLDSSKRGVGCFDRYQRKDGLLLLSNEEDKTRFEHRIIVSSNSGERWSDLQPSDLLYLRSEMIISSGRDVINGRSMSEITGLNRFAGRGNGNGTGREGDRQRQVGVGRRWLAWVSSLSQTTPRSVTVA